MGVLNFLLWRHWLVGSLARCWHAGQEKVGEKTQEMLSRLVLIPTKLLRDLKQYNAQVKKGNGHWLIAPISCTCHAFHL